MSRQYYVDKAAWRRACVRKLRLLLTDARREVKRLEGRLNTDVRWLARYEAKAKED